MRHKHFILSVIITCSLALCALCSCAPDPIYSRHPEYYGKTLYFTDDDPKSLTVHTQNDAHRITTCKPGGKVTVFLPVMKPGEYIYKTTNKWTCALYSDPNIWPTALSADSTSPELISRLPEVSVRVGASSVRVRHIISAFFTGSQYSPLRPPSERKVVLASLVKFVTSKLRAAEGGRMPDIIASAIRVCCSGTIRQERRPEGKSEDISATKASLADEESPHLTILSILTLLPASRKNLVLTK